MFLAGFVSVADWIASNEECFPHAIKVPLSEHSDYARRQAGLALERLGWKGWRPPSTSAAFGQLFHFIDTPRPVQQEAATLAPELADQPALVVVEAPTGEGKTEAAIYLAEHWMSTTGQKGCYFALPTMATSDQMFGRVRDYLVSRYPDTNVNLMLLHGHAALSAEFQAIKKRMPEFSVTTVEADGERAYDGASPGVVASEWFTHRKRGLLAPFGVGTVDQVLLSVLQTRHVFVRLFGLASKTVLIDEVHAYDAYMTTLLERLLEWLAALGTSVVMLSATLPRARRDALLRTYARGLTGGDGDVPTEVSRTPYPRITWTVSGEYCARPIGTSQGSTRRLRLRWVDGELPEEGIQFTLGQQLKSALSDGGCAAVICNTVHQAQKVYQALKEWSPDTADDGQPELDLLHARYLYGDRKKREERSLIRFGKPGGKVQCEDGVECPVRRPHRAVLVATQVIEQSLDLDFDVMVTDMAPADLLLQRAGRMHRHQRSRPHGLSEPTLWVCEPEMRYNIPSFGGGTEAVYDYHVLLRAWLELRDRDAIRVPDDVEELIEAVYDDRDCPLALPLEIRKKWQESRMKHAQDLDREKHEAEDRWIKPPWFTGELGHMTEYAREEDNPELHQAHQALTRLGGVRLNVICLYGSKDEAFLDSALSRGVGLHHQPDAETIRALLGNSVPISHRGLIGSILEQGTPITSSWRKVPLLRHHYILFFSEQGLCESAPLRLSPELGLVIETTS